MVKENLKFVSTHKDNFSKSYNRLIKGAGKATDALKRAFILAAKKALVLGTAAVGVGTAYTKLAVKANAVADEIAKTSRALGINTDSLQALRQATEDAGGSTESLDKSLVKFTRTAGELAAGLTSEAAEAFEILGLEVRDAGGNVKDTTVLLDDTRAALGQLGDRQSQAALAAELFGRNWTTVLKLFENTPRSLKENEELLRDMGLIIDEELLPSAERLTNQWGQATQILTTEFNVAMLENQTIMRDVIRNMLVLSSAIDTTAASVTLLSKAISEDAQTVLEGVGVTINETTTKALRFLGWMKESETFAGEFTKGFENMRQSIENLGNDGVLRTIAQDIDMVTKAAYENSQTEDAIASASFIFQRNLDARLEAWEQYYADLDEMNKKGTKDLGGEEKTRLQVTTKNAQTAFNIATTITGNLASQNEDLARLNIIAQTASAVNRQFQDLPFKAALFTSAAIIANGKENYDAVGSGSISGSSVSAVATPDISSQPFQATSSQEVGSSVNFIVGTGRITENEITDIEDQQAEVDRFNVSRAA